MRTLIIPAEYSQPVLEEDPEKIDLKYLYSKIGDIVEALQVTDEVGMYLHEEGKILNLPINRRATYLARKHAGISLTDYIVGDVVLVGEVDDEGYETGLTTRAKYWIEMELSDLG